MVERHWLGTGAMIAVTILLTLFHNPLWIMASIALTLSLLCAQDTRRMALALLATQGFVLFHAMAWIFATLFLALVMVQRSYACIYGVATARG